MTRFAARGLLLAGALVGMLSFPSASQAISLCIDCTCTSPCNMLCWNGYNVDTCSHYLCVDWCFPWVSGSEQGTEAGLLVEAGSPECLEVSSRLPSPEEGAPPEEDPAVPDRQEAPSLPEGQLPEPALQTTG